ncbi:neurogenic locus Notch protein-like isoform X2 [Ruditapes philippinarum]|uniref:neurogenic locus Notch protein-like isoform X2 n=1 Tax=Ruditapes philippinarum TaxID=129788 RepID=UPI00295B194D|nr:neurogenic locus Notch protein-like isoform X2 [Ruditapes philippinarum]
MVGVKAVLWFAGIVMFSKDFIHCEDILPDLGPEGPTFDTCETFECPVNSTCKDDDDYVYCMCSFGKVGANCDIDDPCLERKTNCTVGSICYGDCEPNVICEAATGTAHCRGCVDGWTGLFCEIKLNRCQGSECDAGEIIDEKEDDEKDNDKDEPVTEASKSGTESDLVCSIAVHAISIIICLTL